MRQALFAGCCALLCSGAGWATDDARAVFDKVAPAVVTVRVFDAAGQPEGHGSGVLVAPGQVATNCHVVQRAASVRVTSAAREWPAEWTRHLQGLDLCLLAVPGLPASPVVLRRSGTLAVGEPVHAVGNPLGFGLAVSTGLVAMLQPRERYALLVATAPVSPGSSGGGLFDSEGRLLGLTTAIMGTGQNLNMVLVADAVVELLAHGAARPADAAPPVAEPNWPEEAQALYLAVDWDGLERYAQLWARAQPAAAPALVYQAEVQNVRRQHAQAEVLARQALALDGDLPLAWFSRATALAGLGRTQEAEQALQQAALRDPWNSRTPWTRSQWLRAQGQREPALAQLREAVRKEPDIAHRWTALGELAGELGHAAEAARAFATAARLDGAMVSATAPQPGNAAQIAALETAGWSEYRAKRYGAAEDAFRKASSASPTAFEAWNGLGSVLMTTGRLQQAEEAFGKALAARPEQATVLANRARLYQQLKQREPAIADLMAALRAEPEHADALQQLGNLLVEDRRYRDAAPIFARLAQRRPLSSAERSQWADALLGIGDLQGAVVQLSQAEADPKPDLNTHLVRARVAHAQGDQAAALAAVERALALDATQGVAWSSKGYALLKLGRLPEAVTALETAVRLDPGLANSWINLGEAQMRARNLGRAIDALEKAIVLAPRASDARYYLALSYLNARLPGKTREHAQHVLASQPTMPAAVELMAASYLVEHRVSDATPWHARLRTLAPDAARRMRSQAIAAGEVGVLDWPQ